MLPVTKRLLLICALLLIFSLLAGTGILFYLKRKSVVPHPPPMPQGSFFPTSRIENSITVIPWADANKEIVPAPANPTVEELNSIYLAIRRAIAARDEKTWLDYVSEQTVWHTENQKKPMGFTTDKKVLFVRISNPQASGQLPEMHWMAPEAADLIPLKVQPGSVGDMADFYLLDQTTGKSERVINTPWRYVQDLLYKTKTEAVNRGTGRVTFVFDRGRWRYQGEIWWPEKREPQSLGDVYDSADRVRQVNSSTPADFAPKILEIGMGEVVVWQGASGLIYSYSTNQEHWTSPFLFKGDTYAKKFNTAGDYYYLIKSNLYELKGEIHVK